MTKLINSSSIIRLNNIGFSSYPFNRFSNECGNVFTIILDRFYCILDLLHILLTALRSSILSTPDLQLQKCIYYPGIIAFYMLPLLPWYISAYRPNKSQPVIHQYENFWQWIKYRHAIFERAVSGRFCIWWNLHQWVDRWNTPCWFLQGVFHISNSKNR